VIFIISKAVTHNSYIGFDDKGDYYISDFFPIVGSDDGWPLA
jgi:hypothetical protein